MDEVSLGLMPIYVEETFKSSKTSTARSDHSARGAKRSQSPCCGRSGYVLETGEIVLSDQAEKLALNLRSRKLIWAGHKRLGMRSNFRRRSHVREDWILSRMQLKTAHGMDRRKRRDTLVMISQEELLPYLIRRSLLKYKWWSIRFNDQKAKRCFNCGLVLFKSEQPKGNLFGWNR